MRPTIPQNRLSAIFAEIMSINQDEAERFISEFFRLASDGIQETGNINIDGFGRFAVNGEHLEFFPSEELATTVNEPFSFFEPVELMDEVTEELLEQTSQQKEENIRNRENETESVTGISISETDKTEVEATEISEPVASDTELPSEEGTTSTDDQEKQDYEPEIFYETVYQTRPWPVIIGVILGIAVGFCIGFLISRSIYGTSQNSPATAYAEATENIAIPLPATQVLDSVTTSDTSDSIASKTANIVVDEREEKLPESESESAVVYDTVTPHRFLATMARAHYGVMEYWIFIYEENRSSLPANPNRITPGTRVVIPPIGKYVPSGNREEGGAKAARMIRELEKNL